MSDQTKVLEKAPPIYRRSLWLVLIGFLPLLFWHIGGLLEKSHYQFLFLMPVALWMLGSSCDRAKNTGELKRWEAVTGFLLLTVSLVGLGFASWVWSPWIAAVCFLMAWAAIILCTAGSAALKSWMPLWIFCWIIVPLPFGMDEDLIVRLRGYTTRMSSSVLDQMGVLHNSYANVIELPGKPLFIADACSGIHSLYVLMAAALFLCAWGRRGISHSVCLLVSTFGLVLFENVSRIVAVAVAWGRGRDWSEGTSHEMLGVALFCFSLFIIVSTDQLLLFFFPPGAPGVAERLAILRAKNRIENPSFEAKKKKTSTPAGQSWPKLVRGFAFAFPVMLLIQFVRMPAAVPNILAVMEDTFDLPELGMTALPETIGGFTRQHYNTIARVPEDPFGQASQQWIYRKGDLECLVSVDYPYPHPHDLTVCYTNIGWNVVHRRIEAANEAPLSASSAEPVAVAQLSRPLYGSAWLIFNHTRPDGNTQAVFRDEVIGDVETRAGRRWTTFLDPQGTAETVVPENREPFLQFQVFVRSAGELSQTEKEEMLELFRTVKKELSKRVLKQPSRPL